MNLHEPEGFADNDVKDHPFHGVLLKDHPHLAVQICPILPTIQLHLVEVWRQTCLSHSHHLFIWSWGDNLKSNLHLAKFGRQFK